MEKYGLLGKKLIHSLSPFIHSKLFELQGKRAVYELIECESIERFLSIQGEYSGYNVTIPYKEDIFAITNVDEYSKQFHAVNCVDNKRNISYNTDIYGYAKSVESIYHSDYGNILLVGFGGVAKVIACKYQRADLTVAIRDCNEEKIKKIKSFLPKSKITVIDIKDLDKAVSFDLLVNATPVGMYPYVGLSPVDESVIKKCKAVYDTIYNPLKTELLRIAEDCGIPCKNGLDMLVEQAVKSHWHWYGAEFESRDIDKIIQDCYEILRRK